MWARRMDQPERFKDRSDAGRKLAAKLAHLRYEDPVVLGLARGGVVIAAEIASALGAEMDVLVARKLGAPMQPELGIGAIAPGGVLALNQDLIERLGLRPEHIGPIAQRETEEVARRLESYARGHPRPDLRDRVVIVADDGLATGYTAVAAVRYVRTQRPKKIVLAVPVCAVQAVEMLSSEADEVVCVEAPHDLMAVGYWYEDFAQTTDDEVVALLAGGSKLATGPIEIPVSAGAIYGDLIVPLEAKGLVIFAHGSGSSRHSPRNQYVAQALNNHGFATLLVDLLTEAEEQQGGRQFDIPMLAERLGLARRWSKESGSSLPVGYFGASTGAAAALIAAARDRSIKAVVSRGGRPDLAGEALPLVQAATLLIVGSRDEPVVELNRVAHARLGSTGKKIEIIQGATHLFPEPGALEQVAKLAAAWFAQYLGDA
jgi:putative phosphoribosyl transferase